MAYSIMKKDMKKEKKKIKNKDKKINEKAKGKVAKEILVGFLEHAFDFAIDMAEAFRHPHIYQNVYQYDESKEIEKRIRKELSQLKQRKFIEERKIGKRLELCLTDKGRKAALRYKIVKCDNFLKDQYCLVVFDIPETERNIRNFFRSFLKEADFTHLQKSVWITQKDSAKHIEELVHIAGAEKWVHIIVASSISNFSFEKKR